MPKVKPGKLYNKQYGEDALQRALEDIKQGAPIKATAEKYSIPRATLQFRLKANLTKTRPGPHTYLTQNEESLLETWLIECAKKGFPQRKSDIFSAVQTFLKSSQRKHPFVDDTPGRRWYKSFLSRHPQLTLRTSEAITKSSANISETDIRSWFSNIEAYLKDKGYFEILSDPSRVFNGDETCFQLCPKADKVLACRGAQNVYEVDRGVAKQNLTVMFSFSADGKVTPPLIIYPYKRLPAEIYQGIPSHWGIGKNLLINSLY